MAHEGHEHHDSFRKSAHANHSAKLSRMGVEHRERGGGTSDREQDSKMVRAGVHEHEKNMHPGRKETKLKLRDGGRAEGEMSKPRHDRPHRRAEGGGSKKAGGHGKGGKGAHVNVIVAPQAGGMAPHPMMGGMMGGLPTPGGVTPMPPPRPPVMPGAMPPPGGPPMGGMPAPGGGAPMMPPRPMPAPGGIPPRSRGGALALKRGGRAHRDAGGAEWNDSADTYNRPEEPKEVMTGQRARGGQEDRDERSSAFSDPKSRMKEQMGPYGNKPARAHGGAIGPLEDKTPKGEGVGEVGAGSGEGRLRKIASYGKESDEGEGKLHRGGGRR